MSTDRRSVSLSLNEEQQEELRIAMEYVGTDSPSVLYKILLRRFVKDNGLVE